MGNLPVKSFLIQNHNFPFARQRRLPVLIGADGFNRYDGFICADICNGCGRRYRVADENGRDEIHRLRKIYDFALFEFVAENGGNQRGA